MLIHLLPFGLVDAGRGGHNQGGGGAGCNDTVRVVPRRAKWVLPRRGQVGSKRAGVLPMRSAVNDSSVTCSEALTDGHAKEGVLCYLSVSNTINIITYTDV